MPNLWVVFLTGLFTGGVSCVAVQGGLLAATVAGRVKLGENEGKYAGVFGVAMFLVAKLAAHILLGFALGLVGSTFAIKPVTMGALQLVAGIYMLLVAGAMLEVHPFFRRFLIQTPKFLRRYVRDTSKSGNWFAPAVLGAATIFIPCGTTQAMMVSAVGTGNPIWGAAIMGTFVLGTAPVFFALGMVMSKLGDLARQRFLKLAAAGVVILAIVSINSALVLLGSKFTVQRVLSAMECTISFCDDSSLGAAVNPASEVNIEFSNNGYKVDNKVVKAGSRVKLNLINKAGYGCVQAFVIPKLGISKVVPVGATETVEITVPEGESELAFSCSMGMYSGELKIVI